MLASHFIRIVGDKQQRKILLGSVSAGIAKILSLGGVFLVSPFIIEYMGDVGYSAWIMYLAVYVGISFADFGVGNTLINLISKKRILSSSYQVNHLITTSIFLIITFIIIFMMLAYFVWSIGVFDELIKSGGEQTLVMVIVLALYGVLASLGQRIQVGYQETYESNCWSVVSSILTLGSMCLAAYLKVGIDVLVLMTLVPNLIVLTINTVFELKVKERYLPIVNWNWDFSVVKEVLVSGFYWTIYQIMTYLAIGVDAVIISERYGIDSVAPYALMNKYFSFVLFAQLMTAPLWVAFSDAIHRKDYYWIQKQFKKVFVLFFAFGILGFILIMIGAHVILPIMVKQSLIPTDSVVYGFAFFAIIVNLFGAVAVVMSSSECIKNFAILSIAIASTTMAMKLFLPTTYGVGMLIWVTNAVYFLALIYGILKVKSLYFKSL